MATDPAGSLAVDVLVIGGGLAGHHLAASLHPRWSVCLVHDPDLGDEALDGDGYLSAGYDGNDVARIQPARRAAATWRMWAGTAGLLDPQVPWWIDDPGEVAARHRLWRDATLPTGTAERPPEPFADGDARDALAVPLEADLVIDVAQVIAHLREPIADRYLEGTIERFRIFTDDAIDAVELEVDGETVSVAPRFVVAAADAGNAVLIAKLGARFKDAERRAQAKAAAADAQAVRHLTTICMRGALPFLHARLGPRRLVSHRVGGDVVWTITAPVRDSDTALGQVDLRFTPALDSEVVAEAVRSLASWAPDLAGRFDGLRWQAYVRRRTEHPMMAASDTTEVGQPAPARLESLGTDSFLALWPGTATSSMLVADVAVERITEALGQPEDLSGESPAPASLAPWPPAPASRWARPGFEWSSWADFAAEHDLKEDDVAALGD
jgi:hypothetical protein